MKEVWLYTQDNDINTVSAKGVLARDVLEDASRRPCQLGIEEWFVKKVWSLLYVKGGLTWATSSRYWRHAPPRNFKAYAHGTGQFSVAEVHGTSFLYNVTVFPRSRWLQLLSTSVAVYCQLHLGFLDTEHVSTRLTPLR